MSSQENKEKILSVTPELFSHLPVAFALMEVTRAGQEIKGISYAYVNARFCELSLRGESEFLGKDIAVVHNEDAKKTWLGYLHEIEEKKEAIKGSSYYAPIGSTLNYIIAPTQDPSYYAVMYTNAQTKEKEFLKLKSEKFTNEKILHIAQKISSSVMEGPSFEVLLQDIGVCIGAKRVYFVKLGHSKEILATYKADPSLSDPISPSSDTVMGLLPSAEKTGAALITNEKKAKEGDKVSLAFLQEGIKTHAAFPFLDQGRLIACLCADDYPIEYEQEAIKILQNSCYFMSYKWANNLLLKKLRRQARHDQLTGLLNRYGYEETIKKHFDKNSSSPCVMALIDIDDFKNINDLYGHQAGDSALRNLSADIVSSLEEKAVCGRYGGDEISVFLPDSNLQEAAKIFSKFISGEHFFLGNGEQLSLSFSIGYAEAPLQASDFSSLLSCADQACYAAKLAGKGCCFAYQKRFDELDKTSLGFNFHSIADSLPFAFMLFGDNGEIYYANSLCLQLLGYKNLLSLASSSEEGIFSLFEEKEALRSLLKEAGEQSAVLTTKEGGKIEFSFDRKNDYLPSIHYGLLSKK